MAGISDKAVKANYSVNHYRYNGKELQNQEFSDGSGLEEYDYGARNYDPQIGRWTTLDPMSGKFVGLSPFSYNADNPVLLSDPNGKDWTLSLTRNENGSWTVNINFKGQVLNSSDNKNVDTKGLANSIKEQFESVFTAAFAKDGDGPAITVNATADISVIDDKKDLAKDATLFEVRNSDDPNFQTDDPSTRVVGMAVNGKEILLNEADVGSFIDNSNTKTLPHEIGHTGGLRHPADDESKLVGPTVPYNRNPSNFMNQGTQFLYPYSNSNFTGVTKGQVLRIYSLYMNDYLNEKNGTHPIERISAPIPLF